MWRFLLLATDEPRKWRTTVVPGAALSFSAAGPNGETCTVTVP
jgi:hypothetical protein